MRTKRRAPTDHVTPLTIRGSFWVVSITLIVYLLLVLLHIICYPARAETQDYYVAVTEVNLRREPSEESEVIITRIRGDMVAATGKSHGPWIEVCVEPIVGWMKLTMLSLDEPTNQSAVVAADGRVRLRESPGGELMKWVQPGDAVEVLARLEVDGESWYRVQHRDVRGWILADCVEAQ